MVEAFSRLFFGAMSATGSAVSSAEDPQQASDEVEGAIVLSSPASGRWPSPAPAAGPADPTRTATTLTAPGPPARTRTGA